MVWCLYSSAIKRRHHTSWSLRSHSTLGLWSYNYSYSMWYKMYLQSQRQAVARYSWDKYILKLLVIGLVKKMLLGILQPILIFEVSKIIFHLWCYSGNFCHLADMTHSWVLLCLEQNDKHFLLFVCMWKFYFCSL